MGEIKVIKWEKLCKGQEGVFKKWDMTAEAIYTKEKEVLK